MDKEYIPQMNLTVRTNNYVEYPYNKLVPANWDPSLLMFRFFADAERGNDSNDGMSWGTAKKTISGALAELPLNLESRTAFIIVHSGSYHECVSLANVSNGSVFLIHAKTSMNAEPWWNPLNDISPVRNNNPIVVDGGSNFALFSGWTQNSDLQLTIDSTTLDDTKLMWGRWIFKNGNGQPWTVFLRNLSSVFIKNLVVDLTGKTDGSAAVGIDGIKTQVRLVSLGIIGSLNSPVCTGSNGWYGALSFNTVQGSYVSDTNWYGSSGNSGFDPAYIPPHNKWFDFDTVRNIYTSSYNIVSKNVQLTFSDVYWNQGGLPVTKPVIYLTSDFGGKVTYNKTQCDIVDGSIISRIISESSTGVTTQYITNKLRDSGNQLIQKNYNVVPADSELQPGEQSFWIDEAANKLKIKVKKANGTVVNGEVSLA